MGGKNESHFQGSRKWDDTVNQDITEMTSSTTINNFNEVMKLTVGTKHKNLRLTQYLK
jgi:hypothetical protein